MNRRTIGRLVGLSTAILFICASAIASSDGESAKKHMTESPLPAVGRTAATAPENEVARVKTFSGKVSIARFEKVIPVGMDEKIYRGDSLQTGENGALGITFKDNTTLSLGPNSVVIVNEFLFHPSEGKLSIVNRIIKGTAVYLSGVIAKLAPQSVQFQTPVATVGFRGTKFLVAVDE